MRKFLMAIMVCAMLAGFTVGQAAAADLDAPYLGSWSIYGMGFNMTYGNYAYVGFNSSVNSKAYGGMYIMHRNNTSVPQLNGTITWTGNRSAAKTVQAGGSGAMNASIWFNASALPATAGTNWLYTFENNQANVTAGAALGSIWNGWYPVDAIYYWNMSSGVGVPGGFDSQEPFNLMKARDMSLVVGIANNTFYSPEMGILADQTGTTSTANATSMMLMVPRRDSSITTTVLGADATAANADKWYFYALRIDGTTFRTQYRMGTMQFTSATAVTLDYSDSATTTTVTSGTVQIVGKQMRIYNGGTEIVSNATIGKDNATMVGFSPYPAQLFVAVKAGTIGTDSDFLEHYINGVFAGQGEGTTANAYGNGTAGFMALTADSSGNINQGSKVVMYRLANGTGSTNVYNSANVMAGGSLTIGTQTIGSTDHRKLVIRPGDQSDRINRMGTFTGAFNKDKTFLAGIYNETAGAHQMMVLFPDASYAGPVGRAGLGFWGQASNLSNIAITDLGDTTVSTTSLHATWTGLPSDFSPVTAVKSFNATSASTTVDQYITVQWNLRRAGGPVAKYRLYKLKTAPTTVAFNYANPESNGAAVLTTDGSWFISTAASSGDIAIGSSLDPATNYRVNMVIKNNGDYDTNTGNAANGRTAIDDPFVLGTVTGSLAVCPTSSSSTGCMFNPSAGFGLEWLLLLIAPALGVIRMRLRK